VAAVVLNVTVTQPTAAGYITVFPDGSNRPTASNINFSPNETVPNLVIAPVGSDGEVDFYNGSSGTVQLIADVSGWYATGSPVSVGGLTPMNPVRLMDTRSNVGSPGPVASTGTAVLQVDGQAGIPAFGVTAVVLNVTVTQPATAGFISVYPDGSTRPATSNINFSAGETVPNLVIAPVGSDGKVDFYNGSSGTVQLIADVSGWFAGGNPVSVGGLTMLAPIRLMDTRSGLGATGPVQGVQAAPGNTVSLQVDGEGGVPASGVGAVILNVTVTQPTAAGFITVYPDDRAFPQTSSLNFSVGETVPNLVIAPVSSDGTVNFYNGSSGTVQLLADVSGWTRTTSPAWTTSTVPWPTPGPVISELKAVSCPSPGTCVAVGGTGVQSDASGLFSSLVETQSGQTWIPATLPAPSGVDDAELNAVSCPALGTCVAVGDWGTVETLANGTWKSTIIPTPSGSQDVMLNGVSCTSAGHCVAVGDYRTSTNVSVLMVEMLTGGVWSTSAVSAPSGATNGTLGGVSCPAAKNCVAMGAYSDSLGARLSFALELGSQGWVLSTLPLPNDGVANAQTLENASAVSCAATGQCIAVGSYSSGQQGLPLVVKLASGKWTATLLSDPTVFDTGVLNSVSCAARGSCVALGSSYQGNDPEALLGATLSGGTWSESEVPEPSGYVTSYGAFTGLTCPTIGSCVAVGGASNGLDFDRLLVDNLSGTTWTPTLLDGLPGPADAQMAGLSCPLTDRCFAVGDYVDASGTEYPLIESQSNGTIDSTGLPLPSGATSAQLSSVSCTDVSDCVAVGTYNYGFTGQNGPLAEILSSGSWQGVELPNPPSATAGAMQSVSCVQASSCVAVGGTVAETLSSGTWSAASVPLPTGSSSGSLGSLACLSSSDCEAVGGYQTSTGLSFPLAESLSGGEWSLSALPTTSTEGQLNAISCAALESCTAVGSYTSPTSPDAFAILQLSGGVWSTTDVTSFIQGNQPSVPSPALTAVSCPSSGTCVAVGVVDKDSAVAVSLDSGSWSESEFSTGSDNQTEPTLNALSCRDASHCLAVGTTATFHNYPGLPLLATLAPAT